MNSEKPEFSQIELLYTSKDTDTLIFKNLSRFLFDQLHFVEPKYFNFLKDKASDNDEREGKNNKDPKNSMDEKNLHGFGTSYNVNVVSGSTTITSSNNVTKKLNPQIKRTFCLPEYHQYVGMTSKFRFLEQDTLIKTENEFIIAHSCILKACTKFNIWFSQNHKTVNVFKQISSSGEDMSKNVSQKFNPHNQKFPPKLEFYEIDFSKLNGRAVVAVIKAVYTGNLEYDADIKMAVLEVTKLLRMGLGEEDGRVCILNELYNQSIAKEL